MWCYLLCIKPLHLHQMITAVNELENYSFTTFDQKNQCYSKFLLQHYFYKEAFLRLSEPCFDKSPNVYSSLINYVNTKHRKM